MDQPPRMEGIANVLRRSAIPDVESKNKWTVFSEPSCGDFWGRPVIKTPCSQSGDAWGAGSIPGQGTKIPHDAWHSQKQREREEREPSCGGKSPVFSVSMQLYTGAGV